MPPQGDRDWRWLNLTCDRREAGGLRETERERQRRRWRTGESSRWRGCPPTMTPDPPAPAARMPPRPLQLRVLSLPGRSEPPPPTATSPPSPLPTASPPYPPLAANRTRSDRRLLPSKWVLLSPCSRFLICVSLFLWIAGFCIEIYRVSERRFYVLPVDVSISWFSIWFKSICMVGIFRSRKFLVTGCCNQWTMSSDPVLG